MSLSHSSPRSRRSRVCFLYIAQSHQVLHSIGAAFELAHRAPDISVEVLATQPGVLAYAGRIIAGLGGAPVSFDLLGPNWLRHANGSANLPPKVPLLVANAARLSEYDAIATPERTSAFLRHVGVTRPKLIYTQHGAGDRAGPFEPRLRRFDMVFAAGEKQRERMLRERLVADDRCAVVGYPKFDLVERLAPRLPRLFADDRPVVVYNPHFDAKLSSWESCGERVLDGFARQSHYNLIFAPHVRLFGGERPERIAALKPFLSAPNIHIDTGASDRAVDMTYTRSADIYMGDVSSQIYEFIQRPRPCLFLNAHGVDWLGDESYGHWRFGEVVNPDGDVLAAAARATNIHLAFRRDQLAARANTFDQTEEPASLRAAAAIASLVGKSLQRGAAPLKGRLAGELSALAG